VTADGYATGPVSVGKALLDSWLTEFQALGYWTTSDVRVLVQEDESPFQAGLVVVGLSNAETVCYLQFSSKSSQWTATMEARDGAIELDARALLRLGNELTSLSALCLFLEGKTREQLV
jgi:hypothetical protein